MFHYWCCLHACGHIFFTSFECPLVVCSHSCNLNCAFYRFKLMPSFVCYNLWALFRIPHQCSLIRVTSLEPSFDLMWPHSFLISFLRPHCVCQNSFTSFFWTYFCSHLHNVICIRWTYLVFPHSFDPHIHSFECRPSQFDVISFCVCPLKGRAAEEPSPQV